MYCGLSKKRTEPTPPLAVPDVQAPRRTTAWNFQGPLVDSVDAVDWQSVDAIARRTIFLRMGYGVRPEPKVKVRTRSISAVLCPTKSTMAMAAAVEISSASSPSVKVDRLNAGTISACRAPSSPATASCTGDMRPGSGAPRTDELQALPQNVRDVVGGAAQDPEDDAQGPRGLHRAEGGPVPIDDGADGAQGLLLRGLVVCGAQVLEDFRERARQRVLVLGLLEADLRHGVEVVLQGVAGALGVLPQDLQQPRGPGQAAGRGVAAALRVGVDGLPHVLGAEVQCELLQDLDLVIDREGLGEVVEVGADLGDGCGEAGLDVLQRRPEGTRHDLPTRLRRHRRRAPHRRAQRVDLGVEMARLPGAAVGFLPHEGVPEAEEPVQIRRR